jgi:hypothetical protein
VSPVLLVDGGDDRVLAVVGRVDHGPSTTVAAPTSTTNPTAPAAAIRWTALVSSSSEMSGIDTGFAAFDRRGRRRYPLDRTAGSPRRPGIRPVQVSRRTNVGKNH